MNRSIFICIAVVAFAATAVVGWRMGRSGPGAPTPVVSPVAAPAAPSPEEEIYHAAAAPEYDARQGRSLDQILRVIDTVRLEPAAQATVDTSQFGELFALLNALKPEEIPLVLDHLATLPPPTPARLVVAVLGRWARHDGAAAMLWAERLPPASFEASRGLILAGWAHHDPEAAWAWYRQAWDAAPWPRIALQKDFAQFLHGWAQRDPAAALAACLAADGHHEFRKWAGLTSLVALPERRAEIMTLITGIPEEPQRLVAIRSALGQWSATAPVEAAAWLDAHMPEADTNLLWAVAQHFSLVNPRANADWLIQRSPPDQRELVHGICLIKWSEQAPDEAAAWVESTGLTDRACQILAGRFAPSDLEKAMSWARRVSLEKRADVFAENLATAIDAGQSPDVPRFAAEAGITPEELSAKVKAVRELIGGR